MGHSSPLTSRIRTAREQRGLGQQALAATGVTVVSLRRASGAVLEPDDSLALAPGDTLVLSGLPEPLALAEEELLKSA